MKKTYQVKAVTMREMSTLEKEMFTRRIIDRVIEKQLKAQKEKAEREQQYIFENK